MMTQYEVHSKHLISKKIKNGTILFSEGILPEGFESYQDIFDASLWANHHEPFAAAVLHESGSELVIIRDHLGMEPLYYTQNGHLWSVYLDSNLPDLFSILPRTPDFSKEELLKLFSTSHEYSDNTLYQGVYRVEPGHYLHFHRNGKISKHAFWALTPTGDKIIYSNSNDYVEHFSQLLDEAVESATHRHTAIASEFSAGLDSTSVYCAARNIGLRPKLFMHNAPAHSDAERRYQIRYEENFFETYPDADIVRIAPEKLDLLSVFDEYAQWFQGPAPYLFFMFAYPLHQAVSRDQYKLLLSGFGGDQGVSTPLPYNFFLPELIAQKNYEAVWESLLGPKANRSKIKKLRSAFTFLGYRYPSLREAIIAIKQAQIALNNLFCETSKQVISSIHPYSKTAYKTLREAEYSLLQGKDSHEVRMRIEYSSLIGKKMGFEYRYPLLYPKLLEFFLAIPFSEKRHQHIGRYLMRRYLNQFFPNGIFSEYLKKEGLDIVPSTMTHYQNKFVSGEYRDAFRDLPLKHLIENQTHPIRLRHSIKGYMLKPFYSSNP